MEENLCSKEFLFYLLRLNPGQSLHSPTIFQLLNTWYALLQPDDQVYHSLSKKPGNLSRIDSCRYRQSIHNQKVVKEHLQALADLLPPHVHTKDSFRIPRENL